MNDAAAGTYETECTRYYYRWRRKRFNSSYRIPINPEVGHALYAISRLEYAGADCSGPEIARFDSVMEVHSLGLPEPEGQAVNLKVISQIMTLGTAETAQDFNDNIVCHLTRWKVNEARDIAGLDCDTGAIIPKIGVILLGRIRENDGKIQMAIGKAGWDRPNQVELEEYTLVK